MAKQWFYRESDGSECGPYSGAELRKLVQLGRVRRETLVRTDTSHGWIAAENVKGLFIDPQPDRGPADSLATSGRDPGSEFAPPPLVDPNRVPASAQTRTPGLATGKEWDNLSEFLANQSTQSQPTGRAASRPTAFPDLDDSPAAKPIFPDLDLDLAPARTSGRFPHGKAILLRLLTDPRDAFGQALAPGMLAYAIGMIAATAVLYVLMWLPFLYRIESERVMMRDMISGFSRGAAGFPQGGMMSGFPRGAPVFPSVAEPVPAEPSPGMPRRVLTRLWEVGPSLLLAAGIALGAVGFLGILATAVLATEGRPQPVRRGVTALGFSLTPLVCLLTLALLIGFVATEIALLCAYFGVFVSVLFYHEASQTIGGIPMNRTAYFTPGVFLAGVYLLLRCSSGAGASLMMGGFPF